MIIQLQIDPAIARIYHAEAERIGVTSQELMASVLAYWPAAQWVTDDESVLTEAQRHQIAQTQPRPR